MKLFFLDDSRQNSPSRHGMGPLIGVGGISLPGDKLGNVERAIDSLCRKEYGFPEGEEFKWSPGHELWMRNNLVEQQRTKFFTDVIRLVGDAGAKATVVIKDCDYAHATTADTEEMDVTRMCLERVCNQCSRNPSEGLVITDRAMGGYAGEDKFLRGCLEALQSRADYLRDDALALNVVSTPSKFVRLLQVADLVTGATLAGVAGEPKYSMPIIEALKPIYRTNLGYIGGYGVKIHPDGRYENLYHWIFGDTVSVKFNAGQRLPRLDRPYATDSNSP